VERVVKDLFKYPAKVAQCVSPAIKRQHNKKPAGAKAKAGLGTTAALAEFVTRPQAENQIGAS
jgi:hypothetical protein